MYNGARIRWTIDWARNQRAVKWAEIHNLLFMPYKNRVFVRDVTEESYYKAMLQFYNRQDISVETGLD